MSSIDNTDFSNRQIAMCFMDTCAIWVAGQLCGYLRFGMPLTEAAPINSMLLYFCCAAIFFVFPQMGVYQSWRGRRLSVIYIHMAMCWAVLLTGGLMLTFAIHKAGYLSRLWVASWYIVGFLFLAVNRALVHGVSRYLQAHGMNIRRVVIVGYCGIGQEMHRRSKQYDWLGYEVKAIYVGMQDAGSAGSMIHSPIERLDDLTLINQYIVQNGIHEVWITLPLNASEQLTVLHAKLHDALVDIRWIPDAVSMKFLSNRLIDFMGMATFDLNQPASADVRGLLKEVFDRVFALVALVLLAPLFTWIALTIKITSPGPVLFKQPRLGLNGKAFNVYKFRSMRIHDDGGQVLQACRDDPRITRFGAFLRRTSLDELPQFINVLKGEMSVVGPRPHALQHNDFYRQQLESYMLRHRVKPGITGWAQINGCRGETDTIDKMARRVQFDIHYIQNWSFLMDIKIIFWTALKGWTGKNAY